MQAIEILDVKPFMQLLFQTDALDRYALISAEVHTDMAYTIDGHIHHDFYTSQESELLGLAGLTYAPWQLAKEKVFQLIRGKKTPSLLKLVLRSGIEDTVSLLNATSSHLDVNDIDGMFLNILFQNNQLHMTCGVSYRIFTMDKGFENEFTNSVVAQMKTHQITCNVI